MPGKTQKPTSRARRDTTLEQITANQQQLNTAILFSPIAGSTLNQQIDQNYAQSQALQSGEKLVRIVPWVGTVLDVLEAFGVKSEAKDIPTFVTGALRANIEQLVDDYRYTTATHGPFSDMSAQLAGYQNILQVVSNPKLPQEYKDQLTNVLLSSVGQTMADLQQGGNQLLSAVQTLSSEHQLDMSNIQAVVSQLVDQASVFGQRLEGVQAQSSQSISLLSNTLNSISGILQQKNLVQQDIQVASNFMLDQLTQISTHGLEQYNSQILSLADELTQLKKAAVPNSVQIIAKANQLKAVIDAKLQQAANIKDTLDSIAAAANFLGQVGDVIGIPEMKKVSQVINGVVSVANGIAAFAGVAGVALAVAVPVGPALAIATGLLTVFSAFSNQNQDNSLGVALQQISGQIQALSDQVNHLGTYVEIRFNHVEDLILQSNQFIATKFDDMAKLLDASHQDIIHQLTQVQTQIQDRLNGIAASIEKIDTEVNALTALVEYGFQHLNNAQYNLVRTRTLKYYETFTYGQAPGFSDLTLLNQDFLTAINWITCQTKNPLYHGDSGLQNYPLSALGDGIHEGGVIETSVLNYINILKNIISDPQGLGLRLVMRDLPANLTRAFVTTKACNVLYNPCDLPNYAQRLINPTVWMTGANDLMQFMAQTPEFALTADGRCAIQEVVRIGENFLQFIITLKTHTVLFDRLVNNYENALTGVVQFFYQSMMASLKLRYEDIWSDIQDLRNQLTQLLNQNNNLATQQANLASPFAAMQNMLDSTCGGFRHTFWDGGGTFQRCSLTPGYCNQYGWEAFSANARRITNVDCNAYSSIIALGNGRSILSASGDQADNLGQSNLVNVLTQYSWNTTTNQLNLTNGTISVERIVNDLNRYPQKNNSFFTADFNSASNVIGAFNSVFNGISRCEYTNVEYFYSFGPTFMISDGKLIAINPFCSGTQIIDGPKPIDQVDMMLQYRATFSNLQSALNQFISNYQQYINNFIIFNQKLTALKNKLALAKKFKIDTLRYGTGNQTSNYPEMLSVMMDFIKNNSTLTDRQTIQAALITASQNAGDLYRAAQNLSLHRHALLVYLQLAFNEEFSLDSFARQSVLNLWTENEIFQLLSDYDPRNATNFILFHLQNAFYPKFPDANSNKTVSATANNSTVHDLLPVNQTLNGTANNFNFGNITLNGTLPTSNQSFALIPALRDYLSAAIARGNMLYDQNNLAVSYWDFSLVLQHLRDFRDYIFPQGTSALSITPQIIMNAFANNDTQMLATLHNMLFNLSKVDTNGNSAIMLATQACDLPTVRSLIHEQVNLNGKNKFSQSVLNLALNCPDVTTRETLLATLLQNGATACQSNDLLATQLTHLADNGIDAAESVACMSISKTSKAQSLSAGAVAGIVIGVFTVTSLAIYFVYLKMQKPVAHRLPTYGVADPEHIELTLRLPTYSETVFGVGRGGSSETLMSTLSAVTASAVFGSTEAKRSTPDTFEEEFFDCLEEQPVETTLEVSLFPEDNRNHSDTFAVAETSVYALSQSTDIPNVTSSVQIHAPINFAKLYPRDGDAWDCQLSFSRDLVCTKLNSTITRVVTKTTAEPWSSVSEDVFFDCETVDNQGVQVEHCIGNKTEYIEFDRAPPAIQPDLLPFLGSSVARGAAFAALPEAVGDSFYHAGLVNETNAERLKSVTHALLILIAGSWLATGTGLLATAILRKMGCSESRARIGGNTVAFFANVGTQVTPVVLAATAANYVGGRMGLWAEKKLVRQLTKNTDETTAVSVHRCQC